jgi:bifunctional non-homologous end joining protein LigD
MGISIKKAQRSAFPTQLSPMLCSATDKPVVRKNYIHELKLDGYRILAYCYNNKVRLCTRGGQNYTSNYAVITEAVKQLHHNVILDGEVTALNEAGLPDFEALQNYRNHKREIAYYVFDILWLDGYNLMPLPLLERKKILAGLIKENELIHYVTHFKDAQALYNKVKEWEMEGIVSKVKDSVYEPGVRGTKWLKTPVKKRQEFVIGAWAESTNGRIFKSLLFGAYNEHKKLCWVGRSGGGYKQKDMPGIYNKLKKLETQRSPFSNAILDTKGAIIHYIKPQLVADFEFSGFTKGGRIRKPATFLHFRTDKNPRDVVLEKTITVNNS